MRLLFTKDANETWRPLLDRMPVMLHEKNYDRWLDPEAQDGELAGLTGIGRAGLRRLGEATPWVSAWPAVLESSSSEAQAGERSLFGLAVKDASGAKAAQLSPGTKNHGRFESAVAL